MHFLSIPGVL